jgi:hypothetical protein
MSPQNLRRAIVSSGELDAIALFVYLYFAGSVIIRV